VSSVTSASFQFTGQGKEVGSIVPLPTCRPRSNGQATGHWQRLEREVAPPLREAAFDVVATKAASPQAEVILETKIDALDITVLRGGGTAVGKWATSHGFLLTPDAPEMPRLLRLSQPDLHGRPLRRVARRAPQSEQR